MGKPKHRHNIFAVIREDRTDEYRPMILSTWSTPEAADEAKERYEKELENFPFFFCYVQATVFYDE